jgi:hypothetical protein
MSQPEQAKPLEENETFLPPFPSKLVETSEIQGYHSNMSGLPPGGFPLGQEKGAWQ